MKQTMFDIIKYWMDLGVDGFRFDAVTKLIEDDRWLDEPSANDPNITGNLTFARNSESFLQRSVLA